MEEQKITSFLANHGDKFAKQHKPLITNQLEDADDRKFNALMAASWKNPTVIVVISIFLGGLGIDRFMLGQIGMGIGKIATCIILVGIIWVIIDWFVIYGEAQKKNYQQFTMLAS